MRRLFASLMAVLGASPSGQAQTVHVDAVRYSMPTVAADRIEYVMPTRESFEGAPQFHEDEWGQLEFFPKGRLAEIQKLLKEFKSFEKQNRTRYGWKQVFARKMRRSPILPREVSPKQLTAEVAAELVPAPILGTSSGPLGQVKEGFALKLGTNAYLYGLSTAEGITVLGANLAGADDMLLTQAFSQLNRHHGLVLVDWRQQFVLVSVAPNGQIDVWKP